MQRIITVTLDDETAGGLDAFMQARGYANRSEAMRDLLRGALRDSGIAQAPGAPCMAVVSYVYDHHERDLGRRLMQAQHDHHALGVATLHTHLDHDNCLKWCCCAARRRLCDTSRKRSSPSVACAWADEPAAAAAGARRVPPTIPPTVTRRGPASNAPRDPPRAGLEPIEGAAARRDATPPAEDGMGTLRGGQRIGRCLARRLRAGEAHAGTAKAIGVQQRDTRRLEGASDRCGRRALQGMLAGLEAADGAAADRRVLRQLVLGPGEQGSGRPTLRRCEGHCARSRTGLHLNAQG